MASCGRSDCSRTARPGPSPSSAPDPMARAPHAIIALQDAAVATSGDYRHWVDVGDRRLSHTMDPVRGAPLAASPASVTVVAATCMAADAWATALMVRGSAEGADLARRHGLDALFLDRDGRRVQRNEGWTARSKPTHTPGARPEPGECTPDDAVPSGSPQASPGHRAPRPRVGPRAVGGGPAGACRHRLGGGRAPGPGRPAGRDRAQPLEGRGRPRHRRRAVDVGGARLRRDAGGGRRRADVFRRDLPRELRRGPRPARDERPPVPRAADGDPPPRRRARGGSARTTSRRATCS